MTHFTDCFLRCARLEPPDSPSLVIVNDDLLLFFIVTFVHVRLKIFNNGGKMIPDQNLRISLTVSCFITALYTFMCIALFHMIALC